MKKIVSIAVIGLLAGVAAPKTHAAATPPTTWAQSVNFSLVVETTKTPSGKYTIATKDFINLLVNDTTIVTNITLVQVTNGVPSVVSNSVGTGTIQLTNNTYLSDIALTNGFPTNSITLISTTVPTVNGFSNTAAIVFTELSSNVYSFPNTLTLTNGGLSSPTNTMTTNLITAAFTFTFAETNEGTNISFTISQPAAGTIYATNLPSIAGAWSLTASLAGNITNITAQVATNAIAMPATNSLTLPTGFKVAGAKLVYLEALDGSTNNWVLVSGSGKTLSVVDVTPFFTVTDVAPSFDVNTGKTASSIEKLVFAGHEGTTITLQGLWVETLGVKGGAATLFKTLNAQVAGFGTVVDLNPKNPGFSDSAVAAGKITTTGAASTIPAGE